MANESFGDVSLDGSMSASDKAASHPNPAFDFLTGFVPRKLKDHFKWCEYLSVNSAHIYAALRKFGELVITDIEIGTSNDALRRNYKRLFERTLKIKQALLLASLDKHVYGNHFTSIYQPFVRYLRCNHCQVLTNITSAEYTFTLKGLQFSYTCPHCKKAAKGKVVDQKILAANKLHIIRWDPKLMDIEYNPVNGSSLYYYNIPQDLKEKVKKGSKHIINSMPYEFLENIRDDTLFRFAPNKIFHIKTAAPAGFAQQWGFPPLAATMKQFLYTMVLRKANEAIALEHIVPMRILHPAQHGNQDFAQMISLGKWQDELKTGVKRWRRDPLHMLFSPTPLGVTNVGGDGRAMLTLGEVQEAEKNIMAALGIPAEFLFGGLTKAGMEGTLRMIQTQLQGNTDDMNGLLQWYSDQFAAFLGWERIDAKLTPLQMVEDSEAKQLIIAMAIGQNNMPQVASLSTMADRIGLDLAEERVKRKQEALDEMRFQQELQREQAKLQNTLAQQVQQQVAGQAGVQYDPQQVMAKADEVAQQLAGLDPGARRSQLHQLQTDDFVMYACVIQRLEDMRNQQVQQAQQSVPPVSQ